MKTAIVTGATGMIASALIRELVRCGVRVYALCKPGDDRSDDFFASPLVTAIDADITALPQTAPQIDAKDGVLYHFAWLGTFGGVRDDVYLQNDNIRYTLDAVQLAHMTGCECVVTAGSQAEYGIREETLRPDTPVDPVTGYGIAKYAAEKLAGLYARNLGLRFCAVRILSVFGQKGNPNSIIMANLAKMLRGEKTSYTKGEQLWDFLHCDDAAKAFRLIGERGRDGACYPLGSGSPRLLRDYILAMRDTIDPALEVALGAIDYPPGQVMRLCADITALTADTGFTPDLTFEDGVRRTADWMKTRGVT